MSTTITDNRLENLQVELADLVEPFVREVSKAACTEEADPSFLDRFRDTSRRLFELNEELHEEDFDPRALAEFRDIIIKAIKDVGEADPKRPLDTIDSLLIYGEQLRHIVRDAMDGHVGGAGESAKDVLESLRQTLPSIRQIELAALLGRSQRQVQRWAAQEGPPPRRLELVARIAVLLRHSWTQEGVVAWFFRPRADLGGKKPVDLLDDPDREIEVVNAARRGRAQHGS
jgi:transcriptional regulator with XRE-family HTH domain